MYFGLDDIKNNTFFGVPVEELELDEVIIRRRERELHPEYYNYEFYGKMDLCEECTENFVEWMNQGK